MNSARVCFKAISAALTVCFILICFPACGLHIPGTEPESKTALTETDAPDVTRSVIQTEIQTAETERQNGMLTLKIDGADVAVKWEKNETVSALAELVKDGPLTVEMSMYGGFEQVGPLGTSLPRDDVRTVTEPGDIVLYSGNQLVIFYGSNSWAYTKLGHIDLSSEELTSLSGSGGVTVTLE